MRKNLWIFSSKCNRMNLKVGKYWLGKDLEKNSSPPNVTFMSTVPNLIFFWHPPLFDQSPSFCSFFLKSSLIELIHGQIEINYWIWVYCSSLVNKALNWKNKCLNTKVEFVGNFLLYLKLLIGSRFILQFGYSVKMCNTLWCIILPFRENISTLKN